MTIHSEEYASALHYQSSCVERTRRRLETHLRSSINDSVRNELVQKRRLTRLGSYFAEQMLSSRGFYSSLQELSDTLKGQDLSDVVARTDELIKSYAGLRAVLDSFIVRKKGALLLELVHLQSLLEDIINNLYECLRLLKRYNRKKNVETTDEAIQLSTISVHSMETLLNGNRPA